MLMDDNLSVHMNDYLANQIIATHDFIKVNLIEAIKHSEKYRYDPSNDSIKLKYHPKRKTIVFRDIPKAHSKMEKILELLNLSNDINNFEKIKNIENRNGLFFVYFHDEETCLKIYRCIEKMKENQKDLPFYFTAFVKVENLKKEWLNLDDDEDDFSGIILNPKEHKPRKLSVGEQDNELGQIANQVKHSFSKFDKFDPFFIPQKNPLNHSESITKNKFNYQIYSNGENTNKCLRRSKAYSINYHKNSNINNYCHHYVPLNKDYPLTDQKIEYKYDLEEITKIFINMNFLKKFVMPDDLRKNFIKDLFNKNVKTQLDQFKKNIQARVRSNTMHNSSPNKSIYESTQHYDEYNNLRHGRKHSLRG